jgi:succinate dehydrogenase / fumarate reductase iron-sulfur subunit
VTIEPMKAFPASAIWLRMFRGIIAQEKDQKFARPPDATDGTWRMAQSDIDRVRNFASASNASCAGRLSCCAIIISTRFIGPRFSFCRRAGNALDTKTVYRN